MLTKIFLLNKCQTPDLKKGKFKEDFDKNLGILSGGLPFFRYEQDISSIIDNLKNCIQKKTYMLNTNYVHFENNYLF